MTFLKKTVLIFLKQLQSILSGDPRLTKTRIVSQEIKKDEISFKLHTERNDQLIKQKVLGIAKLRFKQRKVANVSIEGDRVSLKFIPEEDN